MSFLSLRQPLAEWLDRARPAVERDPVDPAAIEGHDFTARAKDRTERVRVHHDRDKVQ